MDPNVLVCDLASIDGDALTLVGGKAFNLGVLIRAGLPVPSGVCVTTEAYRHVASAADLGGIFDALSKTSIADVAKLATLAGRARAAILGAPVPGLVVHAVLTSYARLGPDSPVAVRSSATAEDLPFASFAGQQDTYLNVVGAEALMDAVRRCWASLWTDRAVTYRATNGIDQRGVRLAVIVQQMVDATVAGVIFTANVVTGRRRQAVIDASPGLGEAVVSGAVNPDHFIVDTASGEIVERRPGDKRLIVRTRPGGGTTHVATSGTTELCISDDQVRALARLGDRVETLYGAPQDAEWAIDPEGRLWLTQARPITTLFPLPSAAPPSDADLRVYFCFSVAQGLNRPITPMGLAAFRLLGSAVSEVLGFPVSDPRSGPIRYVEAGQRVFADLTSVLRSDVGRELMPRVLDVMEARSAVILRQLFNDPRLSLIKRSRLPLIRRILRIASRFRVPQTAVRTFVRPDAMYQRADQVGAELGSRLVVPATASAVERLDHIERILLHDCISLVPRIMPGPMIGLAMLRLANKMLGDGSSSDLQTVVRALPHNVTTEMDMKLWALARRIRTDQVAFAVFHGHSIEELAKRFQAGDLPEVAQWGLAEFLAQYGHRAVAEIDIGLRRWSEDPQHVLGVIASYLQIEDGNQTPDRTFERLAGDAEAMIETLAARAGRRSRLHGAVVRFALRRARALIGLRELPKFYLIVALAAVRRQLIIIGNELAQARILEQPDDVFFVDLVEVREGLRGRSLRDIVSSRRIAYELELKRRHIPRVMLSDGTEPEAESPTPIHLGGALIGTPASVGTVTGTAHVMLDPAAPRLRPGEILVAPSTDPGWTPLFLVAAGLVMEMGGANSHGAVVAREYGIPAVVGLQNATSRIRTGQRLTVDGGAGTVVVLGDAPQPEPS
jgi:pyruvate,water dikinase